MESPFAAHAENNSAGAPPPPAEVKVRTMRSDLESMTKSGGGLPQFENVKVAGLAIEREAPRMVAAPEVAEQMARAVAAPSAASAAQEGAADASPKKGGNAIGIILVLIVAIVAIAAVIYFAMFYK